MSCALLLFLYNKLHFLRSTFTLLFTAVRQCFLTYNILGLLTLECL